MACQYESSCLNSSKCYRCNNLNLLKIKGQKGQRKTAGLLSTHDERTAQSDKSWEDLEQQVANKLNNIPTITEARRSRASGALWFEKGDIVDDILHPECKERKGNELRSGEKSISIKKEWLEKAAEECQFEDKTMCLPFRFKGDSNIYCIFKNDDIATLITTMKAYMLDNELKDREIERLRQEISLLKIEERNQLAPQN
jgi:hypothetical protein